MTETPAAECVGEVCGVDHIAGAETGPHSGIRPNSGNFTPTGDLSSGYTKNRGADMAVIAGNLRYHLRAALPLPKTLWMGGPALRVMRSTPGFEARALRPSNTRLES